jgi:hypothetical protein
MKEQIVRAEEEAIRRVKRKNGPRYKLTRLGKRIVTMVERVRGDPKLIPVEVECGEETATLDIPRHDRSAMEQAIRNRFCGTDFWIERGHKKTLTGGIWIKVKKIKVHPRIHGEAPGEMDIRWYEDGVVKDTTVVIGEVPVADMREWLAQAKYQLMWNRAAQRNSCHCRELRIREDWLVSCHAQAWA